MAKDTVVIGYAHGGWLWQKMVKSILDIREYEYSRGEEAQLDGVASHGGCYVAKNRNEVAKGFLDDYTADWLLFIDTDIDLGRADTLELMTEMANTIPTDILAMPYLLLDGSVSLYMENPKEQGTYSSLAPVEGDQVYEIDAAGTGCLLIHRRVLVKLRDEYPEPWHWFGHDQVGFNILGDDYTFCRRAKKQGFRIHGWTGWIPQHWKTHPVEIPVREINK